MITAWTCEGGGAHVVMRWSLSCAREDHRFGETFAFGYPSFRIEDVYARAKEQRDVQLSVFYCLRRFVAETDYVYVVVLDLMTWTRFY
jgi:hypothetical protein